MMNAGVAADDNDDDDDDPTEAAPPGVAADDNDDDDDPTEAAPRRTAPRPDRAWLRNVAAGASAIAVGANAPILTSIMSIIIIIISAATCVELKQPVYFGGGLFACVPTAGGVLES